LQRRSDGKKPVEGGALLSSGGKEIDTLLIEQGLTVQQV
jgi:hypothetical protein